MGLGFGNPVVGFGAVELEGALLEGGVEVWMDCLQGYLVVFIPEQKLSLAFFTTY